MTARGRWTTFLRAWSDVRAAASDGKISLQTIADEPLAYSGDALDVEAEVNHLAEAARQSGYLEHVASAAQFFEALEADVLTILQDIARSRGVERMLDGVSILPGLCSLQKMVRCIAEARQDAMG